MRRPSRAGAVLLALVAACGGGETPPAGAPPARPKVAIFGVDGATFDVIDPLVAQGRLPALAGLMRRGARAVLQSEIRAGGSAVLWASMATGAPRDEHGILGFTQQVDGRITLYRSSDRRLPALWNMVATRGGSCGLVGWWTTWPAEAVPGYVVSDLLVSSLFRRNFGADDLQGLTHPPELAAELAARVRQPGDLRREDLAALGEFSDAEWAAIAADDSARELVTQDGLAALKYGLQAQRSFAEIGLHLLRTRPQPDLFFVFLELPDRVSHNFWHAWEPDRVHGGAERVDPEWRRRWASVVPGAYELVDAHLAALLAELDPDTTVLVVSDHGFRSSGGTGGSPADLRHVGHSGTHDEDGVLIAAGPAIRAGATCEATLYDVAPTVLAALGLPGTTQGVGRVLEPLLDPAFLAGHPLLPARDEPARPAADPRAAGSAPDDERLRQLQAIGYMLGAEQEVPGQDGDH